MVVKVNNVEIFASWEISQAIVIQTESAFMVENQIVASIFIYDM
jgi:hypothetical protein